MSLSLIDAYNNKVLSEKSLMFMPKTCRCGQDLELSDSLTELRCSDKECQSYTILRSSGLCKMLRLDISKDDMLNLIDKFNIISPYQLLELDSLKSIGEVSDTLVENIEKVVKRLTILKSSDIELYEILSWCGIADIEVIAKQLAYGFNSFDEFFNEIDRAQVSFINERLGIKTTEACVLAHKIYNEILDIRDELYYAESMLKVKEYTNRIFIAFNDNCGQYLNKTEVLNYLNNTFDYTFVHTELVNEQTDILVKHLDQSNYKYRNARLINEKSVAEKVNSNEIMLDEADKFISGQLKPLGHKIYIDNIENIMKRLELLSNA